MDDLAGERLRAGGARSAGSGLRSAVAFPVIRAGSTIGVIELLGRQVRHIDDELITMLSTAGVEIGQFIQRCETAQALRRARRTTGRSTNAHQSESRASAARASYSRATLRSCTCWSTTSTPCDRRRGRPGPCIRPGPPAGRGWPRCSRGIPDQRSLQVRAATGSGRWLWLQMTATSIPDSSGRARAPARDGSRT